MKRAFTIILSFVSFLSYSQEWIPVWNEEFDYSGLPNENKWNFETGCAIRNNEAQFYAARRLENTKVENGVLSITARKEAMNGCKYSSGAINTKFKADWLYGKIEVRAKLPKGKGMWPAIWMMSTDESYGYWPRSGEIDIMENVGFDPNKIFMTIHTEAYNHAIGTEKGGSQLLSDVYNTYHIYSIEWFADRVDFYIDGIKYYTFNKSGDSSAVWPFNKPFYLIINVAVGGSWGGAQGIDESIFPQQMNVDYVRVSKWQTNAGPYIVNISSTSGGSVSRNPVFNTYTKNSLISVKAVPNTGYIFAGWQGDVQGDTNPIELTVLDNINIKALFKAECDLIHNGNFVSGIRKWSLYTGDGAIVQQNVINEQNNITITNGGTNVWSTQLSQGNIAIENGKTYKLSFDAYSEKDRIIKPGVGKNSDPYNTYSYYNSTLTKTKKNFSYIFKMNDATDTQAKILFDIGANDGDVFLSNVSLCDLSIITLTEKDVIENNKIENAFYQNNKLKINFTESGDYNLSIYNISGKILKTETVFGSEYIWSDLNLIPGVYSIKIINQDGKKSVLKIAVLN